MAQIGKSVGRTNEITTVSTIKPGLTLPLRVFLDASAGRLLHKVLENIETIHYACWMIVPMNGRDYLVFISNYTGSFEKYIDEEEQAGRLKVTWVSRDKYAGATRKAPSRKPPLCSTGSAIRWTASSRSTNPPRRECSMRSVASGLAGSSSA